MWLDSETRTNCYMLSARDPFIVWGDTPQYWTWIPLTDSRYKNIKEGHKRILMASDVVGRGINIEHVNVVINYDMPDSADTFLHRVERAGHFGNKGLAITFVSSALDSDILKQVQERFEVDIKEIPKQIDTSTYMPS